MKKLVMICASAALFVGATAFTAINKAGEATVYNVDAKKSKVDFSGSKKDGYHPGYFPVKEGTVSVVDGKITAGTFTIDMAGVKVTDDAGAMLEGHLKKGDFFDTEKFGEATFEITKVKYKKDNNAEIEGNVTLKGVKAEIKFDAVIRDAGEKGVFAEAFFSLDRTKLGIVYGAGKIANDVQIGVHLYATK
ncbi:MAG: YceI family protein [Bacteroidetes bacterium]|nr:YceI family protein [Bacteroidota bacterium]